MKKINVIYSIIFITFLTGCGFKVENQSKISGFDIAEINTSGDKRINFKIRNKLFFNSQKNQEKIIKVNIFSEKNKTVKEKNIKNEITKYQIQINIKVNYSIINDLNNYEFSKTKTGDYTVTKQHSQTLNNEKKTLNIMTEKLAEEILDELRIKVNDL
tara:strand:+ start:789 stop:1262 length:474 start_codon:yes stop_codon:yes gene_type:complete